MTIRIHREDRSKEPSSKKALFSRSSFVNINQADRAGVTTDVGAPSILRRSRWLSAGRGSQLSGAGAKGSKAATIASVIGGADW